MLPWQPFLAFYILGAHWRHLKNTTEPPTCGGHMSTCVDHLLLFLGPTSIIRPHRSTTYVDAAYSYRSSSVVCRSVCRSVTLVSPAKTAASIELPFGLRTWVSLGNYVLDGGPDPPMGRGKFLGENGRPMVKYRDTLRSSVQRRLNR